MSQAEIRNVQLSMLVDQQIRWLDISMNHALLMGIMQRLGGLNSKPGDAAEEFLLIRDSRGSLCDRLRIAVRRRMLIVRTF